MQTQFKRYLFIRFIQFLSVIFFLVLTACNKTAFLAAKPSSNLVVPSTLQDFQQLLDNQDVMSETGALGTLASDEYFLQDSYWPTIPPKEQNAYVWASDLYNSLGNIPDWNDPYIEVFYANEVLDGLKNISVTPSNQPTYNNIKGWAYFVRAYAFYNLVQVFAPMYDSATAATDLGIPIKLKADINEIEQRSSVQKTYEQILSDLSQARDLLPSVVPPDNRNRPSRPAVFALLARIYLAVKDYPLAGAYADSAIQIYPSLIDYNTGTVISINNDETIYQSNQAKSSQILFDIENGNSALIDTSLYALYDSNDLRKAIFFKPNGYGYYNLVDTYDGLGSCFSGLATDECYLIRAESRARSGDMNGALTDLNALLILRYVSGNFVARTATSAQDALIQVLLERRKELFLRGVRFTDLRRLNKEGYNIILRRTLNGKTYTLESNSPLYVMPSPPDEISLSGITQNPR